MSSTTGPKVETMWLQLILIVLVSNAVIGSDTVNVALYKPATTSSTCSGGLASEGNDGDDSVIYDRTSNPCVHTCEEREPYWRVDLQQR